MLWRSSSRSNETHSTLSLVAPLGYAFRLHQVFINSLQWKYCTSWHLKNKLSSIPCLTTCNCEPFAELSKCFEVGGWWKKVGVCYKNVVNRLQNVRALGACCLRKFLSFVAPKQQFSVFLDVFEPSDAISLPSNLKNWIQEYNVLKHQSSYQQSLILLCKINANKGVLH